MTKSQLQPKTDALHKLLLYFQVHQPRRLRPFQFFDIGSGADYFDDDLNEEILHRIAIQCYLPANQLLLDLIRKYPAIRVTFSISGTTIEQFEQYAPEVLMSFRDLASTGCVEFLGETYYHSLACMLTGNEFEVQVIKHTQKLKEHFGVQPSVFRNTELIYSNDIGSRVSALGFKGMITEGIERVLNGRSPHHIYSHPTNSSFKLLLRNYRLSDDIAFRFNTNALTADRYIAWLNQMPSDERLVNVALDYETFGEHQKSNTGIFLFLKRVLAQLGDGNKYTMVTPTEAIEKISVHSQLFVPGIISWADKERDLSAWLGNDMQRDAFDALKKIERNVRAINDFELLHTWRQLQTSDHFYYMSTKGSEDGNIHAYFSPYASPYEGFINYMNIISDFSIQLKNRMASLRQIKREGKSTLVH